MTANVDVAQGTVGSFEEEVSYERGTPVLKSFLIAGYSGALSPDNIFASSPGPGAVPSSPSLSISSLELRDTQVCEPYIRGPDLVPESTYFGT
jgi:hypothetical protein